MLKTIFRNSLFLILVILLANCADNIVESTPSIIDETEQENLESTFSEIQTEIFNKSCAFSGCHAGSVSPNLSGNSYSNIVNQSSSVGTNYITPNDPNNSYLLQKVMPNGNFQGSLMPRNSAQLTQNQIDAITEWINAGAPNN